MNKMFEVSNKYHDYKDYTREFTEVGRSIPRLDGPLKVTGKLQYTDDLSLPRMCYAKILRSPHAHAIIKNIDFSKALELEGVLDVLTGKDFPVDYGIVAQQTKKYSQEKRFVCGVKVLQLFVLQLKKSLKRLSNSSTLNMNSSQ